MGVVLVIVFVLSARSHDFSRARPRGTILVVYFAEVVSENSLFDVFESPKIVNDVAAGVVEKDVALFIPAYGDKPLQMLAVFQQIIDDLIGSFLTDDGDFGSGAFGLAHERRSS
jgi:hypothetical protein